MKFLVLFIPIALILGGVVPRYSVEDLLRQSPVILRGTVEASWPAWDPEHKYIWTHHRIRVTDQFRGPDSRTFEVAEPGGELDGVGQISSGSVAYGSGEDVVLFLYRTPIGYWRTAGGPQGKMNVDAKGMIHPGANGSTVVSANSGSRSTPLTLLQDIPYAQFRSAIMRLAVAHPARGTR